MYVSVIKIAPLFDASEQQDSRVRESEKHDQNEHDNVQHGSNGSLYGNKQMQYASKSLQCFHLQVEGAM